MYSITRVNSLKEQVLDTLRKEILRGNIKSGDFLVESELARKFNISRGPIREAISILESDGLIKKNESGQIYVTELSKKDVYEIYSLRSVIEGFAAKLAVEKLTEKDFDYLEKRLDEILHFKHNEVDLVTTNKTLNIHKYIIEKSNHKKIIEIWHKLNMQLKMLAVVGTLYDSVDDIYKKHLSLIETLRRKDPIEAEETMRRHIMEAWEIVERHLSAEK